MMKTHRFANGDVMPLLGLGTWKSQPGEVYEAVREALRVGYRHIDCAAAYGNESEIGSALRDGMRDGGIRREELWITSKLWNTAHGRDKVGPALSKTLADLGLDYLDLYLIHWPVPLRPTEGRASKPADFYTLAEVPLHDTWAGMEGVVRDGKARHIGVSNFSSKKLADVLARATIRPEVDQVESHPLLQQPDLLRFCAAEGIHVTAYSPLGSSDRPAFARAADAPVLLDNPVIHAIAAAHGYTPAQVLIAWHLQRGISTLPKSVKPARLRENLAAAELELTPADMERIASLDRGYRLLAGDFWVVPGGPWTLETLWD
jgi:alcohol dehydrogenase (NADP+)